MTDLQAEVVVALADSGLRLNTAAKKLYRHVSTIHYHVDVIRRCTGLDPLDFYDMQKLVPMAKTVLAETDHKKGE